MLAINPVKAPVPISTSTSAKSTNAPAPPAPGAHGYISSTICFHSSGGMVFLSCPFRTLTFPNYTCTHKNGSISLRPLSPFLAQTGHQEFGCMRRYIAAPTMVMKISCT